MNTIFKTIPRHTEEQVALDQQIEIHFMVDVNKSTFRSENIILFNMKEQQVEPVEFSYNRRILKVTPKQKLMANSHYQLHLLGGEKGIADITGRIMAQTYEVEFRTKDTDAIKPPVVLAPTDVSEVRGAVEFILKDVEGAAYYELQISRSNAFHNLVWPPSDEKVYRVEQTEVTPKVAYQTGLHYMRVRSVGIEGERSSWSDSIRFFFDNTPSFEEAAEEAVIKVQPAVRQVFLQAASCKQPDNQLSQLQNAFSMKEEQFATRLSIKSSKPKDKSVNTLAAPFNSVMAGGNQRRIVIEFSDDIDPSSVTALTAYVLSERN